jgi:hypothetical protein
VPSLSDVPSVHTRYYSYDKLTSEKTSAGNEGYPPTGVDPSSNPNEKRHPFLAADGGNPVVLS